MLGKYFNLCSLYTLRTSRSIIRPPKTFLNSCINSKNCSSFSTSISNSRFHGQTDDIVLFEYVKKDSGETGPALVGIELAKKEDYAPLAERMLNIGMRFKELSRDEMLMRYLV